MAGGYRLGRSVSMTTGSSVGCCRSRPFCGTGRADPTASRWRSPGFRPVFPWLQGLSFQTLSCSLFLSHRVGSSLSEQSILSGDRSEPQRVSHPALPGSHFFLRFHLFSFRERGREGEREGEKHQCAVAYCVPPAEGPGPQPRHVS